MNEMIERVARAIADADMEDYMEFAHRYDAAARAAIEAMREPSEKMVLAGKAVEPRHYTFSSSYLAMIDAALEETP